MRTPDREVKPARTLAIEGRSLRNVGIVWALIYIGDQIRKLVDVQQGKR